MNHKLRYLFMPGKRLLLRIALLAIISFASIIIGFFLEAKTASFLFLNFGYWIILSAVALFLWSILAQLSLTKAYTYLIHNKTNLILLGGLSIFLYTREPARYKVIHDEPNLASTAIGLHEYRQPAMVEPSFQPFGVNLSLDKRPLLFPFLVATTHDLFGYDSRHPFLVNLTLTFLLLVTLHEAMTRSTGRRFSGWLAVLMLCSHPLLSQNASGGGFEVLNLLLLVTIVLTGARYLSEPSCKTQNAFITSCILIAHTRYESALFVIPVVVLVLAGFWRAKRIFFSPAVYLGPLLLLSIAWQNTYIRANPNYWQIPEGKDTAFSLVFLSDNLASSFDFLFRPHPDLPGSPFVFAIGILSLLTLLSPLKRTIKFPIQTTAYRLPFLCISVTIIFNFTLLMFYHWGKLSDPTASRLSLPLILLLVCAFGFATSLLNSSKPRLVWLLHATVGISWMVTLPIINQAEYTRSNPYVNRNEWVLSRLSEMENRNFLTISPDAPYFTSLNLNSITQNRALLSAEKLHLHLSLKTYDSIFLVQSGYYISKEGGFRYELQRSSTLGPAFKLELIDQTSFHPYNFTRLVRLVDIDLDVIRKAGGIAAYYKSHAATNTDSLVSVNWKDLSAWKQSLP